MALRGDLQDTDNRWAPLRPCCRRADRRRGLTTAQCSTTAPPSRSRAGNPPSRAARRTRASEQRPGRRGRDLDDRDAEQHHAFAPDRSRCAPGVAERPDRHDHVGLRRRCGRERTDAYLATTRPRSFGLGGADHGTFRPTDFGVNGDQLRRCQLQRPFTGNRLSALAADTVNGVWRL
jgi:hypothetical protein